MSWVSDCDTLAKESNEAFGQSVLYRDSVVTTPVTLTCPVTRERRQRRQSQIGTIWVLLRQVFVVDSVQAVRRDGKFEIDGQTYDIESLEKSESGSRTICNLQRCEVEEITRPGYRG